MNSTAHANSAMRRLQKEYQMLQMKRPDNIIIVPSRKDFFECHFLIHSLKDGPYAHGFYHGKLFLSQDYPFKPPSIIFITPSGRFQTGFKICMSISNHHPEGWSPLWNLEAIVIGIISFFNSEDPTVGAITASLRQRQQFAQQSMMFNMRNTDFTENFSDYLEELKGLEAIAKQNLARATASTSVQQTTVSRAPAQQNTVHEPLVPAHDERMNFIDNQRNRDDHEAQQHHQQQQQQRQQQQPQFVPLQQEDLLAQANRNNGARRKTAVIAVVVLLIVLILALALT